MKSLRKEILNLAEAVNEIKLPAGFKKPEGWDRADEEEKREYLDLITKYSNYINGGWKREGFTIPQLISQLQQAYKKYGDIRIIIKDPDQGSLLVNKISFNKKLNRLEIDGYENDYDEIPLL